MAGHKQGAQKLKCEKCGQEHDGLYGSGRFCSLSCSKSRNQSIGVIRAKTEHTCIYCGSLTYNEVYCSRSCLTTHRNLIMPTEQKRKIGSKNRMGRKIPNSILDLSKRTTHKVLRRMGIGCSVCGWKDASLDIHHILPIGEGGGNENANLTLLCPNHHRMIHSGCDVEYKSVPEHVGENWRDFYYAHA